MNARARQSVLRERRQYNKLAASQTLEDFALRYTPTTARRWSTFRVASAAVGATSFLACEAIGGGITLAYGASNAWAAIAAATVLMFLIGLPIAYYAAREGLDVDLLTRGAGFGYLGSTITSLIYASFTFLLFAIEASIMSVALELVLGVPLWIAHMISSLVVIPIAIYGMRLISRMQMVTQPVWIILQLAPIVFMLVYGQDELGSWSRYTGRAGAPDGSVDLALFGLALSTLLSLLPQIGEQADYLRFMPAKRRGRALGWWAAVLASGPGWVLIGAVKLLLGSAPGTRSIRPTCSWRCSATCWARRPARWRRPGSSWSSASSRSTSPTPTPARSPGRTSSRGLRMRTRAGSCGWCSTSCSPSC